MQARKKEHEGREREREDADEKMNDANGKGRMRYIERNEVGCIFSTTL